MFSEDLMAIAEGRVVSVVKMDGTRLYSQIRPIFSFEYDGLFFLENEKYRIKNGEKFDLTDAEIAEIRSYLTTVEESPELTARIMANQEKRAYLLSTDWYVIRQAETGIPVPEDILEARQLARESIQPI